MSEEKQVITGSDVEHIAHLARIELRNGDRERFASQLSDILKYVNKLREVDTEGVEPTFHVASLSNVLRNDEVKPSLDREDTLSNAPDREDNYFKMPKILNIEETS